jgi:hypothetical protein
MIKVVLFMASLFSACVAFEVHSASANPIQYRLDFGVTTIISDPSSAVKVGDVFHGFFTVDSAILKQDGLNQGGDVSAFRIQMINSNFDMNRTSDFRGFRGPTGLGSSSPGFDVSYGEIVNLSGGVFGQGDARFVDFSPSFSNSSGPNTFHAQVAGGVSSLPTSFFSSVFQGTMDVRRLPEPSAFLLVLSGLVFMAGWHLRRSKRNTHSKSIESPGQSAR